MVVEKWIGAGYRSVCESLEAVGASCELNEGREQQICDAQGVVML